jgi:hypothetical protein
MTDKTFARATGVLYLVVALLGMFAQLGARAAVYVPGDAAATTENIVANATMFRLGFVADLIHTTLFMFVGLALYRMLRQVSENVARVMVVFVSVATSLILANMIHHVAALLVATEPSYAADLGVAGSQSLVLLLLDMHHYGYLIAQIFFGLWLLPLGYLVFRSRLFPRALGIALVVACVAYLTEVLVTFLVPGIDESMTFFIVIPAAIAELWIVFYLLIFGIRSQARAMQPA